MALCRRVVYAFPLRQRLPSLPIPLRQTDRSISLNLQALLDQCYTNGRYDSIDYSQESDPPLTPEDAAWASELLKAAGRR